MRGFRYGYDRTEPLPRSELVADFRSDTVTVPTEGMRRAMFSAEVGDDVYREDAAVERLEREVAEMCGKEAALFCASGTMANQIALRCSLGPLQSILCDARAHIYTCEAGGVAFHSQAHTFALVAAEGRVSLTAEQVKDNIYDLDVHNAVTAGVALENTLWGRVLPQADILAIREVCDERGLFLHLDGARLPNACVAQGISLEYAAKPFDSLSICLSKSLGCPIGSVIVGSKELVTRARHFRKLFGGGWRQAGFLAAAASYALENHWSLLEKDNANAKLLSEGFTALGFTLDVPTESNQVWINSTALGKSLTPLKDAARKEGILVMPFDDNSMRLVTHLQTPTSACETLLRLAEEFVHH